MTSDSIKDQIKKPKMVPVLKKGVITEVEDNPDKVRYEFVSPNQFFSNVINLLPMQNSVTAARAFYEHKFITQALPIKNGESPNVQSLKDADKNESYEDYLGKKTGVVTLDDDEDSADILDVTPDYIRYKNNKGETKTKNLYNNFAFNRKTMLTNYANVKKGQHIERNKDNKQSPILAKTNYTDDNGTLNMGMNARVGMVPYKGWSMDDAVVISEDFAKKLTSQHMYQYNEEDDKNIKTGKNHFKTLYPDKYSKEQLENIDDNGVIKVGSKVNPGDPIIVSTKARTVTSNDANLGRLSKYLKNTRTDASQVWDHSGPGIVTDVTKTRDGYKVNIEADLPTQVGDKLCYHPDTEVFTEKGWKNIKDITFSDKVLALIEPTHGQLGVKFAEINKLFTYDLKDEPMECYEDDFMAYYVTPNHKCPYTSTSLKTESANALKNRVKESYHAGISLCKFISYENNKVILRDIDLNKFSTTEHYTGKVYCLEVNTKEHIILTRFNNKPIFSSNSTRAGNKLTISKIIPMNEMPRTMDGKPLDVLFNQLGLVSRVNANTMYEAMLGKVAEKTGKKYKLPTFNTKDNAKWYDFVENELKKNNLSDVEEVYDPLLDRKLDQPIAVGNAYFLKLHHTSESKISSRGQGIYSQDEQPVKGGEEGMKSKRHSGLENAAILSSGAYNVIKDAIHLRGQRNDDYWRKVRMGQTPTLAAKSPFIWDKYLAIMQGSGINTKRTDNGESIQATPFTDKDFDQFNPIEIQNDNIVDFKTMRPLEGGLFDPAMSVANKWGKITLDQHYPNPAFEDTIISLLGIKKSTFNDIMSGKETLRKYGTGPEALYKALKDIDIDRDFEQAKQDFKSGPKSKKQNALNRIMALDGLKRNKMSPEEFMISKVPVLPPKFRPYSIMGDTFLPGDANELYQDVFNMANTQKEIRNELGDEEAIANSDNVYKSLKALYGYGEPNNTKLKQRGVSGFLQKLIGGTSKFSQWNRSVISKPVDFSARSVIDPNPEISMDEMVLPYSMGIEIYAPYIQRELSKRGYSLKESLKHIKDQDKVAREALETVAKDRWVSASRSPAWHKFSYLGFIPKFHDSNNILINPIVNSGLGADYDGDAQLGYVYVCIAHKLK